MTHLLEIVTTTEDQSQAQTLANLLIQRRLAACAQIDGPIQSTYYWDGEVKNDTEFRITIKTIPEASAAIHKLFGEHHPYDLPQWIERVSEPSELGTVYANWVRQQVHPTT